MGRLLRFSPCLAHIFSTVEIVYVCGGFLGVDVSLVEMWGCVGCPGPADNGDGEALCPDIRGPGLVGLDLVLGFYPAAGSAC